MESCLDGRLQPKICFLWMLGGVAMVIMVIISVYLHQGCGLRFAGFLQEADPEAHIKRTIHQHTSQFPRQCSLSDREMMSLEHLVDILEHWRNSPLTICSAFYSKFTSIFDVTVHHSILRLHTPEFKKKMLQWLGGNREAMQEAANQTVIFLRNKWTGEENIVNLLRDKRPKTVSFEEETNYVSKLISESRLSCDLCNYTKYTSPDIFGRLETNLSYTVSNAFKFDAWNSMVVFRTHDPHHWTTDMVVDSFQTSLLWCEHVQRIAPDYIYPHVFWDLLPKSSSSQIHPHIHITLHRDRYYGEWNVWHQVTKKYARSSHGRRHLVADMVDIHRQLGLAVQFGNAVAFANLVARRDNEIVVISDKADLDFFKLIGQLAKAYITTFKKYTFSLSAVFPPMDMKGGLPAIARMVTRGTVSEVRSDVSSLELFAASNANVDPFHTASQMRKFMQDQKHG